MGPVLCSPLSNALEQDRCNICPKLGSECVVNFIEVNPFHLNYTWSFIENSLPCYLGGVTSALVLCSLHTTFQFSRCGASLQIKLSTVIPRYPEVSKHHKSMQLSSGEVLSFRKSEKLKQLSVVAGEQQNVLETAVMTRISGYDQLQWKNLLHNDQNL